MKNYLCVFAITLLIGMITQSCSSTKYKVGDDEITLPMKVEKIVQLDERLARVPGVVVRGTGANAQVRIRGGANSFGGNSEPLFILNGQALSGGYTDAFANVDPHRIKRVKVLKGAEASAYGARGGSGVVEITTH